MSEEPVRILLVEDEAAHAELVRRAFEGRHPAVHLDVVDTLTAARARLADPARPPHLIIADWRLPDGEGIELLTARATPLAMPVIVMTSHGNERVAVEAMKAGALDYVVKSDASLLDMPHLAEHALREWAILTERARMEQALRTSEDRFRSLVQNSSDLITIHMADGTVVFETPSAARLLGYGPDGLIGRNPLEWVHPDDVKTVKQALAEVLSHGNRGTPTAYRLRRADGAWCHMESVAVNLLDYPGIQGIVLTSRDVTERKRAERALRQQADRLNFLREIDQAILAAQSSEAIARAAIDQLERLMPNRRMAVLLFDAVADEVAVVAASMAGEIDYSGRRLSLRQVVVKDALRQGQPYVEQDAAGLREPSPVDQRMLARGVRSYMDAPLMVNGELIGLLSLESDEPNAFLGELSAVACEVADQVAIAIQQSRLLEQAQQHAAQLEQRVADRTQELAIANERLTELDRLKSKFVSDVSHELRTPIANLKLYADLLERGQPEKQAHYITVLKQQTQRLSQLVEDILDLSRLEIDRQNVIFGPVDLPAVIDQIVAAHQPRAEAAGLTLAFAAADDLPPVRGDIHQLTQVMTNLIVNALNYTAQGWVRVTMTAKDGQACVQVTDSGQGIAPADLPHIFDRFYRGRQARRREIPGTGLGLAIVKEIVELHHGSITVDSRMDEGTTFEVRLTVE